MSDNSRSSELRVAFIGGGSGGHLFPALAVAEALAGGGPCRFLFLVSHRPVDRKVLSTATWAGDRLSHEACIHLPSGSGLLQSMLMLPEYLLSFRRMRAALRRFRPHVSIGVGAAASVPGIVAADHLGIPVALMEQNTVPGKAIQWLSSRARITQAGLPFEQQFATRWPGELLVTGTPVRSAIASLAGRSPYTLRRERLLILGGSQGSASVNRLVLEALRDESCIPSDWEIVHQTGESQVESVAAEYARRGRTASVFSFIPDLPAVLKETTIVVSRSGAGTLQELACASLPAILIPLSTAAAGHQLANARRIAAAGAAMLVEETAPDAAHQLLQLLRRFVQNRALRETFRGRISEFARPNAAVEFANAVRKLASAGVG